VVASQYGCKDSVTKQIIINGLPKAEFQLSANQKCVDEPVTLTNISYLTPGNIGLGLFKSKWNFNSEYTTAKDTISNQGADVVKTEMAVYSKPSTYYITLKVTSTGNCVDSVKKIFNVNPLPVAAFEVGSVITNKPTSFTNKSTISNFQPLNYTWDFGDGVGTSNSTNPDYTYTNSQAYTVKLITTSPNGCKDSVSQTITTSSIPVANFSFVPQNYCAGAKVDFTNSSTVDAGTLTYLWNFGNGQTSILSNPTTGYTNYGTYTVQLEVINGLGSNTVSKTITLSDIAPNTVTDIDGNIYNTITIGSQLWMKENLNVQRFKNGEAIPNVTDNTIWGNLTTAAWCRVNNNPDASNAFKIGLLYNGYVAQDARGVCPNGWKVPDDSDFNKLVEYLGASSIAGGKLKEANGIYSLWNSPNTGATNESGFTALPGGWRVGKTGIYTEGNFTDWGYGCRLWTKSNSFAGGVYLLDVYYVNTSTNRGSQIQSYGSSIRCIKE
jgi:uncharacterized protein (TIGR02145 family)